MVKRWTVELGCVPAITDAQAATLPDGFALAYMDRTVGRTALFYSVESGDPVDAGVEAFTRLREWRDLTGSYIRVTHARVLTGDEYDRETAEGVRDWTAAGLLPDFHIQPAPPEREACP